MTSWIWSDPRWKTRVGEDRDAAVREALRRAVNLRDELSESDRDAATKAVLLVDALNHVADLLGANVEQMWDRT